MEKTAKRPHGSDSSWDALAAEQMRQIPQPKVLALRRLPALHDTAKFPHPADFTEVSRSKTGDRPLTNTSGMKTGTYVTSQELKYEIYLDGRGV